MLDLHQQKYYSNPAPGERLMLADASSNCSVLTYEVQQQVCLSVSFEATYATKEAGMQKLMTGNGDCWWQTIGYIDVLSCSPGTGNESGGIVGDVGGTTTGTTTDPRETFEMQMFEQDYKAQMSATELSIYNSMSRQNQISYLINAKTAIDMAVTLFPTISQHNTQADAFRHAYFSLLNVHYLGFNLAKGLGDAHEENYSQPLMEKQMDLYNNNIGRNAYYPYFQETALWSYYSNIAYNLVVSGKLVYISNGTLIYTNQ